MSRAAIMAVAALKGVEPLRFCVLMRLAVRSNSLMSCTATVPEIADDAAMSEKSVRRCLDALAGDGWLVRKTHKRPFGGWTTTTFTLTLQEGLRVPVKMVGKSSPRGTESPDHIESLIKGRAASDVCQKTDQGNVISLAGRRAK